MEILMTMALMGACFRFGWILGHATGYERGRNERPR